MGVIRLGERATICRVEHVPAVGDLIHGDVTGVVERVRIDRDGRVSIFATPVPAFFEREDAKLTAAYWSGGTSPNAADFYFAVIARWGRWFKPKSIDMPNIRAFQERMATRPSVQRATAREGNTLFS